MATLFGTIIVAACASVQPGYVDMCQKTFDASARQIGIRQRVDQTEDLTSRYLEVKVKSKLSEPQLNTLEVGLIGYKIYRDKKVSFRTPTLGLCSSVSNDISLDTYVLSMNWRF